MMVFMMGEGSWGVDVGRTEVMMKLYLLKLVIVQE